VTTAATRSAVMSRIRSRDTRPEIRLRKALWARGLRYRLQVKPPTGRPDIVFKGARVAVFVDGCFWHGCPQHYVRPRSREEFWSNKLRENVGRDCRQTRDLEQADWRVCRFWECEVWEQLDRVVDTIHQAVRHGRWSPEDAWRVQHVTPLDPEGAMECRELTLLRDPARHRSVEQPRSTKKWRSPRT